MDLSVIRKHCKKKDGGLKKLATDIGMSVPNLHRCLRENKIQASDLEKISQLLGVDIRVFFDELPHENPVTITAPTTAKSGDEESHLREIIAEKDKILEEKERLIQILLKYQMKQ